MSDRQRTRRSRTKLELSRTYNRGTWPANARLNPHGGRYEPEVVHGCVQVVVGVFQLAAHDFMWVTPFSGKVEHGRFLAQKTSENSHCGLCKEAALL